MPWISIAAAVVGGAMSSESASSAAGKQSASTDAATAENRRQYDRNIAIEQQRYDQNRTDRAPYMGAGRNALAQYLREMGLPYQQTAAPAGNPIASLSRDQLRSQLLGQYTTGATPGGLGLVWRPGALGDSGGYTYGEQEPTPGRVDEAGLNAAIEKQYQAGAGQSEQPWVDQTTAPQGIDPTKDPGYQFGLEQGQQAIDRKTAAAGGRVSGASLKAAAQYGTDYATTGYSAAYQRRQDRLSRLQTLAGYGSTPASGSTGQQPNNGNAALISSQGNATGAATLAQGNIWGNAINQAGAAFTRGGSNGTYTPGQIASANSMNVPTQAAPAPAYW